MEKRADIVICGAGIAGIAAAYHLAVGRGLENIVLVDERPPFTLTSDKSTEAYRNWWPGPDGAMVRLMNRSIDLLEELAGESGNVFSMNRRGYLFATADPERIPRFRQTAERAAALGVGPLRIHAGASGEEPYLPARAEGYQGGPEGADLLLDPALIRAHFPYLSGRVVAALHARRCGWFSGQQLGMYLLERARERGVRFLKARVEGVKVEEERVRGVRVSAPGSSPESISTGTFVNAAGPMLREVGAMLGIELPVYSERHVKASFNDVRGAIPRDAPMLIWEDPQRLAWGVEERRLLADSGETEWLLEEFPPGVHARPEGGAASRNILVLWAYDARPVAEVFPLPEEPLFPEIVLRGMSAMAPGLTDYLEKMPRPFVDGGYYTRTRENRLLCGPLPVEGAYVIGALSGYGLMSACAAGELLAAHVAGGPLPEYAPAFSPRRYEDPAYVKRSESWGATGQL